MPLVETPGEFSVLREHIESIFGNMNEFAKKSPTVFAHEVLSHGFMDYSRAKDIGTKIRKQVILERIYAGDNEYLKYAGILKEGAKIPQELYPVLWEEQSKRILQIEKKKYLNWVEKNLKLSKELIELGWKEYLED